VPGSPDVALVSPGATFGWRRADEALARHLRDAGADCRVVAVPLGRAATLRRTMATTDVVEALAARRAARGLRAGAVIYSSVTAALLQPAAGRGSIRFDGIAAVNRPGPGGAWQRRRERGVLARAGLLLPWSEGAAAQARDAVVRGGAPPPEQLILSPPVATAAALADAPEVLAYAGNPDKRGLELMVRAWARLGPGQGRLGIGGVDRSEGLVWLRRAGVREAPGIEWMGTVERERWLGLTAGARVFLSTPRIEDWGLAQMEALAAGTPLVTVPCPGVNAALALARSLAPALVPARRAEDEVVASLRAALALGEAERASYADAARALLAPYSEDAVRERVAAELLPRLLRSSS
jgi:glycosyltransferase involved in cell wall biosynthesis